LATERRHSADLVPFPVLLVALAAHRVTGVVRARRRHVRKTVFLEDGVPVDCHSNLSHEVLHRYLVAAGHVREEQTQDAFAEASRKGVLVGELLVERGAISPSVLFKALQACLAKRILDLFSWEDGEFEVSFEPFELRSALPMRVPQLVLTGALHLSPAAVVEQGLAPLVKQRLRRTARGDAVLHELRLNGTQMAVVDAYRMPTPLVLDAGDEQALEETKRLVYALLLLGVLAPVQPGRAESRPPPRPGSIPPPGDRPSIDGLLPPTEQRIAQAFQERESVYRAFLSHRRKDAFELLELSPQAPEHEVEAAFLAFSRKYFPDRFDDPLLSEVKEKARVLYLEGARAYALLADGKRRAHIEYLRAQREAETARAAEAPRKDEFAFLDSAAHFKRGKAHGDRGEWLEAVRELSMASDCEPGRGEYRAEAARARWELARVELARGETLRAEPVDGAPSGFPRSLESVRPGSFRTESTGDGPRSDPRGDGGGVKITDRDGYLKNAARRALAELDEALRVDAQCGIAAYYAGDVALALQDFAKAEAYLRRAAKLMAPDRRPLDALYAMVSQRA
jgi:curved DNA-binding protein CbpA